jgi:hypothetical protein
MEQICKNCKWGTPKYTYDGFYIPNVVICKRYPRPLEKSEDDYCGEFTSNNRTKEPQYLNEETISQK